MSTSTASGTSACKARAAGCREVASAMKIPCRSRTAAASMDWASSGRKWWNAVKTVRKPTSRSGTSVVLTDSGSNWAPGVVSATRRRAAAFGYLSVRQTGTSTPLARSAGRRSGHGPPPPEQRSTIRDAPVLDGLRQSRGQADVQPGVPESRDQVVRGGVAEHGRPPAQVLQLDEMATPHRLHLQGRTTGPTFRHVDDRSRARGRSPSTCGVLCYAIWRLHITS